MIAGAVSFVFDSQASSLSLGFRPPTFQLDGPLQIPRCLHSDFCGLREQALRGMVWHGGRLRGPGAAAGGDGRGAQRHGAQRPLGPAHCGAANSRNPRHFDKIEGGRL